MERVQANRSMLPSKDLTPEYLHTTPSAATMSIHPNPSLQSVYSKSSVRYQFPFAMNRVRASSDNHQTEKRFHFPLATYQERDGLCIALQQRVRFLIAALQFLFLKDSAPIQDHDIPANEVAFYLRLELLSHPVLQSHQAGNQDYRISIHLFAPQFHSSTH